MASYSAVIDVRVAGLNDVQTLQERVAAVEGVIKRIKPVPAIFDQRVKKEVKEVANDLSGLIESFAKGGGRFANTVAGLNQQLAAFRTAAGNAKIGSDQFNNSLIAGERASRQLAQAEAERLQVLNKIYTNEHTQGRTRTTGVQEILDLGKKIPNSIAGLELYENQLRDVLTQVTIGTSDFYALSQAIDAVNKRMDIAKGQGPMQGPALPPSMLGSSGGTVNKSPIGGGKNFPGSPGAKAAMAENLMLGAGFPLLFGGGAGQVAGGLLGSFVGTGFGGQILGSAIGQQLEDAQRRIAEIGVATKDLNMDALRDSAITVNAELTNQVRLLQEAGNAEAARSAIADQVTLQTGLLPGAVQDVTNNVGLLGNTWNEFLGAVSGTLSIIGAPFVTAITVILQGAAKILQLVNLVATALGGWVKSAIEGIAKFLGLQKLLEDLKQKTAAISEEEQKRVAALQAITDKQNLEITYATKLLQLESQRQLGRTLAEKEINASIDSRIAKNQIEQQYAQKAKDLRTEYASITTEAGKRELELALAQNEALKTQALKQQEIKDSLAQQGLAIEANTEKYNQATTAVQNQIAALDRGNAVTNSRYGVEAALNDLYGAQLERQYQLATTETERFQIALKMFDQQINAARIEYNQALANNQLLVQKAELEAKLTEIKLQQLEAEKQISLAYAETRGATPEVLAKLSAGYDKGLKLQQSVVEESYKQLQATSEIAANQDRVAEAVYKTKVIQAESQLAQKLASDEIGMSKENADQLAGALAIGVLETQRLDGAMSDVAASAHNAAVNIARAFAAQQQLNAAQGGGGGGGKTPTPTGAAAGAYWKGGFKAFAAGGMVNKPTLGLIGEGGEPEYIVPESKAKNFAMNYMMGARGATALNGSAGGGYAGPSSATVSIQTGPVMQMNGANYVTTGEMVQAVQAGVERTLALIAGDQNMRRSVGIY